jgi:outer membrane protein, heavy metal efflux system
MKAILFKPRTPGDFRISNFEFRIFRAAAGLILLSTTVICAVTASTNSIPITPDYLNQLAEEMRTNNPALKAAYARTNAAQAGVNAVRTWEDPMARLGGVAAREPMRADEGDIIYGIEQKLPLFGKPQLARRVAQAELATEIASADYQFQTLRRELAQAAFQTALASQVATIGRQDVAWLDTMTADMENKFKSGQATLVEVLLLENERGRRVTQLQTDHDQLAHEQVALNRLLNRPLHFSWPELELPAVAGPVVFSEKLADLALKYEPKTEMLRQQVKQAEATAALTRRQRRPDVNVGLEARNYSGDGSFRQGMLVFSMNLPWGNGRKYDSEILRDDARLKATEFDLADYQLELHEEVHMLTLKINAARREALLYRDQVMPRTQSALESARAGWNANQNAFRDVLDARRMLLDARLMYARAVSEQYRMLSELVLCCGVADLGALQMIGALPDAQPENKSHEN